MFLQVLLTIMYSFSSFIFLSLIVFVLRNKTKTYELAMDQQMETQHILFSFLGDKISNYLKFGVSSLLFIFHNCYI